MTKDNYIVICSWMVTELGLSGNELLIYGLIYGFSQDGSSVFSGTARYIAEHCNIGKKCALQILKRMTDEGLLEKRPKIVNGVQLCDYVAVLPKGTPGNKSPQGGDKKSPGGGDKKSPLQDIYNNINNTKDNTLYKSDADVSQQVKTLWNDIAKKWGLSQLRSLDKTRMRNFNNLISELNIEFDEFWKILDNQIEDSLWLRGKELNPEHELVDREWRCTFDFLVEPRSKGPRRGIPVIEGKYADPDLVRIRQKRAAMEKEVNAKE